VSAQHRRAGRIGGFRAWALNDPETMIGAAHRAWHARFDRLVDPEGVLDPQERAVRADRAMKAYMGQLAIKSAAARRKRKARRDRALGSRQP
jgi:hypothetical protein